MLEFQNFDLFFWYVASFGNKRFYTSSIIVSFVFFMDYLDFEGWVNAVSQQDNLISFFYFS